MTYTPEFEEWLEELRTTYSTENKSSKSKPFIGARPYIHLDGHIRLHEDIETGKAHNLLTALNSPDALIRHKFLPFVRRDSKQRRYISIWTEDEKSAPKRHPKIKQKVRQLMYASHRDAVIYGYYGWLLKRRYENLLISEPELNRAVIGYRKIVSDKSGKGKTNIDFANDAKNYLSEQGQCVVLCIDISDFFGSLDHDLLLAQWRKILEVNKLPADHAMVYKNITKYRYFFRDDLLVRLNRATIRKGKLVFFKRQAPSAILATPKEFNRLVKDSKGTNNPLVHVNKASKGIPQGSPISDILANMYMIDFDRNVLTMLASQSNTKYYRRYSDDILIICDQEAASKVYDNLKKLANDSRLKIKDEKTEAFLVNDGRVEDITFELTKLQEHKYFARQMVRYLGFEINTNDLHVRSGTIARHYRREIDRARARLKERKNGTKTNELKLASSERKKKKDYFLLVRLKTNSDRVARQVKRIKKTLSEKLNKIHDSNSDS